MDLNSVTNDLNLFSLNELKALKASVENAMQLKRNSVKCEDFLELHSDFVQNNSIEYETLMSELETLMAKQTAVKTATKWLTSTGEEYVWSSSNGHTTTKEPIDIVNYPGISKLMGGINSKFGCKLNSCLASMYKSGSCATRYHNDDEESIDQSQGIYVVSFGGERTLDIIPDNGDKRYNSDYHITPKDCSLYIMKPGCQEYCLHKVRADKSAKETRYSLSFRCQIPKSDANVVKKQVVGTTLPNPTTTTPTLYYRTVPRKPKSRKTTVLFGTSMTKFVRENRLGFGGRKVVNVSQSGAKIRDITENIEHFHKTHSAAKADDIEKIILSVGTNDIKHAKHGVQFLRKYLTKLIDTTKQLFPAAIIIIQCCLPIKCLYSYIAKNVLDFNNILKDLCFINNCVFLDCFADFLTRNFISCNSQLYHDWLHLNMRGVGILSTWLKFVVNEHSFDRVVNNLLGI